MPFKPGTIVSIKLQNFVTYESVTMWPGPNLNLIMGPNGTGKSTIMCAIVIGLGGNLNVIGRATTLAAYVREGFQKAIIEIELVHKPRNIVITRSFSLDGTNRFEINGKVKTAKEVHEVCKSCNIQVDNLCQFLPQDRVQDFAKLNAQELLLSTQRSVANSSMSDIHQELIALRNEHREKLKEMEKLTGQLKTAQQQNERVQNIVTNIEKQNELKDEVKVCKMRLEWLHYDNCREEFEKVKGDRKLAQNELNKLTKKAEPLEQTFNTLKNKLIEKNSNITATRRSLQTHVSKIRDLQEVLEQKEQSIKDKKNNLMQKIKQSKGRQDEIVVLDQLMSGTKTQLVQTLGEYKTRDNIIKKISSLTEETNKYSQKINDLESKRSNIISDLNNSVNAEIRLCNNRISECENVKSRKMDVLKQLSEDAYKAALWLKDNHQMFRANVYAPMIVELNVKNPEYSKYLENTVANRDLLAFTCELSEDMNLFISKVKNELRLKVNVVHSAPGCLNSYIPKYSIDHIKKYGFFSYLLGLVSGPEPILSYLCKSYYIHRIPIGNKDTNQMVDRIPSDLSLFFTDNFRYSKSVSKYSKEVSTSTIQITEGKLLNHNVDLSQKEKNENRLRQLIKSSDDLKNNISMIESSMQQLNEQKSRIMEERKEVQTIQNTLDNLLGQLKRYRSQMEALKSDHIDREVEKETFFKFVSESATIILNLHKELSDGLCRFHEKIQEQNVNNIVIEQLSQLVNMKENELLELKDKIRDTEKQMQNIVRVYERTKKEAQDKYNAALAISNNISPQDERFPNKEKFEALPVTISELEELIEERQTRVDFLNTGDGNVYQEFQQRKNDIERTSNSITTCTKRCTELVNELETKGKVWCSEIQSLIQQIRDNFGRYMNYLDCAGDVTLVPGTTEHDYDEYGISIKVRYRGAEMLQELNRFTQSGGERAVATAIFLLSLQEITNVPFRCVDEINQGMDPVNERRVFELLVRATRGNNTPQYFLLTPKLLPNLPYSKYVTIHGICSGNLQVVSQYDGNLTEEILESY